MKKIILIITLMFSLQGCFFVVGAAAGAAVAVVVYDHRTIEKIVGDQRIATAVANRIRANHALYQNSHINVNSFNQVILLTGETPTAAWRDEAGSLARGVPGVNKVYNELTIKGPSSSLTRASDTWISTKIKSEMLAMKDLKSGSIKVVVENGVVYLMGIVSREQADNAVDIARQVSGVQKVIKMFQYRN